MKAMGEIHSNRSKNKAMWLFKLAASSKNEDDGLNIHFPNFRKKRNNSLELISAPNITEPKNVEIVNGPAIKNYSNLSKPLKESKKRYKINRLAKVKTGVSAMDRRPAEITNNIQDLIKKYGKRANVGLGCKSATNISTSRSKIYIDLKEITMRKKFEHTLFEDQRKSKQIIGNKLQ